MLPLLSAQAVGITGSGVAAVLFLFGAGGAVAVAHLGALSLGFVAGACELITLVALRSAPEMVSAGGEAAGLARRMATGE